MTLKAKRVDEFFCKLYYKDVSTALQKQFDELLAILPFELKDQFKEEAYIAGGSIWTYVNLDKYKDIDFFIQTKDMRDKLLDFFDSKCGEHSYMTTSGRLKRGKYDGFDIIVTENAITIDKIYQIIIKDYGTPEKIVGEFDFLHSMNYVKNGELFTFSMDNIDSYDLIFNDERARNLCGVLSRIPRFVERGMKITQTEHFKILLRLRDLGFEESDIETMEYAVETSGGSGGFGSGGEL